jgi:hypothetical protein
MSEAHGIASWRFLSPAGEDIRDALERVCRPLSQRERAGVRENAPQGRRSYFSRSPSLERDLKPPADETAAKRGFADCQTAKRQFGKLRSEEAGLATGVSGRVGK